MARLEDELAAGRLAHAYLFVGPQGVGRATTARALFQAANCQQKDAERPCGQCGPCHRFLAGTHEDLIVIAPPSDSPSAQIKVEQVREVIRTLSFAPFAGGVRMVIIKNAGQLNPASSGALLKTLEEPPPNNILVLTVQDPAEVLPTLVSRCRRVNFTPLAGELIREELVRRGDDPQAAGLKAATCGGSLGRALEIDQEALSQELEEFLRHLASRSGPLGDWSFAEELVGRFKGKQRMDRQGIAGALDLWAQYFRDQAALQAGREAEAPLAVHGRAGMSMEQALEGFGQVRQAQNLVLANAAPELCLTVLLQRLRELGV